MHLERSLLLGAAQRLGVDGQRLGLPFARGEGGQPPLRPGGKLRLEGGTLQAAKDVKEGRGAWGLLARKAHRPRQFGPVVSAPLGDGVVAFSPAQGGGHPERQDGAQRVPLPAPLARILDLAEHLHQGPTPSGHFRVPSSKTYSARLRGKCIVDAATIKWSWEESRAEKENLFPASSTHL